MAQRNFEHAFRKNFSYYGDALRRRRSVLALSMHIEAVAIAARGSSRSAPDAYRSASPARCAAARPNAATTVRAVPIFPIERYIARRVGQSPAHPSSSHVPHSAPRRVDRDGHRSLRLRLALDKPSPRSQSRPPPRRGVHARSELRASSHEHRLAVAAIEGGDGAMPPILSAARSRPVIRRRRRALLLRARNVDFTMTAGATVAHANAACT